MTLWLFVAGVLIGGGLGALLTLRLLLDGSVADDWPYSDEDIIREDRRMTLRESPTALPSAQAAAEDQR